MAIDSTIQRAFIGGILSPAMGARADVAKYLTGLAACHQLIIQPHGGATKRGGTRFLHALKDSSKRARLVPFIFEAVDQTYTLEFGDGTLRFSYHKAQVVVSGVAAYAGGTTYALGDLVVSGGVNYYSKVAGNVGNTPASSPTQWYALTGTIYEIPTPYTAADVGRIQWAQSADVLTIVHPSYAPIELKRLGHTTWTISAFSTAPSIGAPASLAGSAGTAGTLTMKYVVTAIKQNTFEESYVSNVLTISSVQRPTEDAPNPLAWTAPAGAIEEYNVYLDPHLNGIFGFVGVAKSNSFNDVGFVPDFTITPPIPVVLFNATGDYPSCVGYHQQRLWFGNTNNDREKVWGSKIGAYHNHSISTPLQDDDAVSFVLAGAQLNPVSWLLSLKHLLVGTDGVVSALLGDDTGTIVPTALNPEPQTQFGASPAVRPVPIGNAVLFAQARGTIVRDLSFDQQAGGFDGVDLTILASHLFVGYSIVEMAFSQIPLSVLWVVRSDGVLLGLTYVKDQDVWAWHTHDTAAAGVIEQVCVVPDTPHGIDVTYLIVKRTIGGQTKRYVEVLENPFRDGVDAFVDAFCVDSGLTYSGSPIATITGLSHLEGETVAIFADGAVLTDGTAGSGFVVSGGAVALGRSASKVHAGLAIPTPELETLDLDVEGTSIRAKEKRVQGIAVLLSGSTRGFLAGPDRNNLEPERPEPWESTAGTTSKLVEMNLTCAFEKTGRVVLRHSDPTPFSVLAILPQIEVGG